jgi:hypothetical protein
MLRGYVWSGTNRNRTAPADRSGGRRAEDGAGGRSVAAVCVCASVQVRVNDGDVNDSHS